MGDQLLLRWASLLGDQLLLRWASLLGDQLLMGSLGFRKSKWIYPLILNLPMGNLEISGFLLSISALSRPNHPKSRI
jgi:hypothetical protein